MTTLRDSALQLYQMVFGEQVADAIGFRDRNAEWHARNPARFSAASSWMNVSNCVCL